MTATCLLYKRFGYNQNRYGKKTRILANTFCSLTSTIIYTLALVKASKRLHSYATARSKQQELGLVLTNRERKIIDTMAARKNMLLMASSAAASGHRCEGGTELAAWEIFRRRLVFVSARTKGGNSTAGKIRWWNLVTGRTKWYMRYNMIIWKIEFFGNVLANVCIFFVAQNMECLF